MRRSAACARLHGHAGHRALTCVCAALDLDKALAIAPTEPAYVARKETLVRALNRATAFNEAADDIVRKLTRGEDGASTGLL